MLDPLRSLPELQVLNKEDKKSVFQYAHFKRLKHWQFYVTVIVVSGIGIFIIQFLPRGLINNVAIVLTVYLALTIADYTTKSIFKQYAIEYIEMLNLSRNTKPTIK